MTGPVMVWGCWASKHLRQSADSYFFSPPMLLVLWQSGAVVIAVASQQQGCRFHSLLEPEWSSHVLTALPTVSDMHIKLSVGVNLNVMVVLQGVTLPCKLSRQNRTSSTVPQPPWVQRWKIDALVFFYHIHCFSCPWYYWCVAMWLFSALHFVTSVGFI